ncbi:hypothetical protein BpHYR1_016419 [Brachionus plicatilis]|uniref:Uncharacterized protein n=1 Tax=Brachionus plicatilis TaxID=10195 RepID=A0A3M7T212_BRAPC|nr:hypothetical protein BpHYR1_016419 [Brachionus plicatilis]
MYICNINFDNYVCNRNYQNKFSISKMKFLKLKNFLLVLLLWMVTDLESPIIDADIERQHKEQFYAGIEALKLEDELKNKPKTKKTRTFTKLDEYEQLIVIIETEKSKKRNQRTF